MAKKRAARGKLGISEEEEGPRQLPATGPGSFWWMMYGPPTPVGRPAATKAAAPKAAPTQTFLRPTVEVEKFINLEGLFQFVQDLRKDPNWRPGVEVPIMPLANPSQDPVQITMEIARQFKIPDAELARYGANAWQYVVEPFLKQIERAINIKKPRELPGNFKFQFGTDRSFGLSYGE